MSATKQPRNLEIVVHQRETPFVGLRAHLRERGLLIPPTLPRATWEPPAAHYPLNDASEEVITGDGVEAEAAPAARRPMFSLPTSLPSSAPAKSGAQAKAKALSTPMQPALPPPAQPKALSTPMQPALSLPVQPKPLSTPMQPALTPPVMTPPVMTPPKPLMPPPMQAAAPGLPPPPRPASMQISRPPSAPMLSTPAAMHQLPTAGYDSSPALMGLVGDDDRDPPTAELKWRDAEALLQQSKAGPGAMPVDDSPRTSRAEQHTVQLDLSSQGFSLTLSFISQTADHTPMELLLALRGELGNILAHEIDQPHLLATDRAYVRHAEQVILRFFNARMPQYPVVTADLAWLHA